MTIKETLRNIKYLKRKWVRTGGCRYQCKLLWSDGEEIQMRKLGLGLGGGVLLRVASC